MSITVNIYYKGENGSAVAFAEEMKESGTVDFIRSEEGNERYEYWFSEENPDCVLLIDRWRDQKSLDIHHSSPAMEKIAALREKYKLTMTVERFEDTADIPDGDKKFIR